MLLALTTLLLIGLTSDGPNSESGETEDAPLGASTGASLWTPGTPGTRSGEGPGSSDGTGGPFHGPSTDDTPSGPTGSGQPEGLVVYDPIDPPPFQALLDLSEPDGLVSFLGDVPAPRLEWDFPPAGLMMTRAPGFGLGGVGGSGAGSSPPSYSGGPGDTPGGGNSDPGTNGGASGGETSPDSDSSYSQAFNAPNGVGGSGASGDGGGSGGPGDDGAPGSPGGEGGHPPGDPGYPVAPINPVPVPEPGTLLLIGGGAAVALVRRMRARP